MRVRRLARRLGVLIFLFLTMATTAGATQGRIEARARVVDATAARAMSQAAALELQRVQSGARPSTADEVRTVRGAGFRLQWLDAGDESRRVLQVESIDS